VEIRWFILLCLIALLIAKDGFAYKTDTHIGISKEAENLSENYWMFLQEFSQDPETAFGLTEFGSFAEDNDPRYLKHFYDPIYEVGLSHLVGHFETALSWGYQSPDNEYSWTKAREHMYQAVTSSDQETRDTNFRQLFRSLGQVLHLMEDMAQPSHVRNDPHVSHAESAIGSKAFNPSHLEDWAQIQSGDVAKFARTTAGAKSAVSFDDSFETLALYSNENFFSDDTIFKNYELPSKEETNYTDSILQIGILGQPAEVLADDGQKYQVPYIIHKSGGYKLAQVGYFGQPLIQLDKFRDLTFQIDDEVARENAQILIPQAVAYSAGLLNYFFRGRITTPKTVSFNVDRTGASFDVYNETPNEEAGPGKLVALATYRPYEGASEISQLSVPVDATSLPRPDQGVLHPEFIFTNQIPITVKDLKITVVFRGKLGAEDDAVMGYVFAPIRHYVNVIQDGVTQGGSSITEEFSCDYPTCSSDDYTVLYNRERRRWVGATNHQTLTGRFVTRGEIKRIDLLYNSGFLTLSGAGKLFINGQEMVKGYWVIGDTNGPPANWRVEVDPDQFVVNYLITVRMGDESSYTLVPASYKFLQKEANKQWGVPYCGACPPPSPFVLTRSTAEMDVNLGNWLTPDLDIIGDDQWELVQLSGYGPNAGSEDTRLEELSDGTKYALNYWRTAISINIARYTQESSFSCNPCTGKIYDGDGNVIITYEEDLYNRLQVPDFVPLSVTGSYHRVYSQAELDVLTEIGIEPVYYDLILN